jgi:hypothetical protein
MVQQDAENVHFLMAIPFLEPDEAYTYPCPVSGVLYVDSMDSNFFIDGDLLEELVLASRSFLLGLEYETPRVAGGIFNFPLTRICKEACPQKGSRRRWQMRSN